MDELDFDWERQTRIGFGEAVLCEGKTPNQIEAIFTRVRERGASCLFTRLDAEVAARLAGLDYDPSSRTGFVGERLAPRSPGAVCILTAGTSDAAVAREAERTLSVHGHQPSMIFDVGVAGIHRLMKRLEDVRRHKVVIVVAGMDGALASVVAGQVPSVVIAVPTSVGYGAARGGETALSAMLASCAAGLTVVNIDNGFGAACAALRHLNNPAG